MNEIIDKFELYSFCFYLYFFVYTNNYFIEHQLLKFIFYNLLSNYITTTFLNFNIFTLILHKYLKQNLKNICIPQTITCLSNIYLTKYQLIISLPLHILINYFILSLYKENNISRNTRFIITFCYICKKFIF